MLAFPSSSRIVVAILVSAMLIAGCAATGTPASRAPASLPIPAVDIGMTVGPVALPSGIDIRRMSLLDAGQTLQVYVNLVGIDDSRSAADVGLLFPRLRGGTVGTSAQLNRRFVDMIRKSNRFEVYDDTATGIRNPNYIVVDGMVTYAGQRWQSLLAQQKAVTTVRLSVQLMDHSTGEVIPPNLDSITGTYGTEPGEGSLLERGVPQANLQDSLVSDFDSALQDALAAAADQLERRMRPLGRVEELQGNTVALFGGERHGLHQGDTMVAFRPTVGVLGNRKILKLSVPLAIVRCDSVNVETSQCEIVRRAPGVTMQPGDYAVLSNESLNARVLRP